ncbi:MAG: hypothetical protein ACO1PM_08715 [Acidovorax sp.]
MNTPHRPTAPGLLHRSARSTVATQFDPATGVRRHVVQTSLMEIRWIAGEYRVQFGMRTVRPDAERISAHRAQRMQRRV